MAVLTQGTEVYILVANPDVPGEKRVVKIDCPTAFQPGEDSADQIDVTCLDAQSRAFLDGLRTPGQGSLTVNADPRNASHLLLYQMSMGNTPDGKDPVKWAVGWSDGRGIAPVLSNGNTDWDLPDTRTWLEFDASVSTFPFDFSGNAVVATNATISRSGDGRWIPKAGTGTVVYPTEYELTVTDAVGFILRAGAALSGTIAHDADDTEVESAIRGLSMAANVAVAGTAPTFTVTLTIPTAEMTGYGVTIVAQ